jgi:hypothetical protein
MKMATFKVKATELNNALSIVRAVVPRPLDKQENRGYLFVIRGQRGYVYSRDAQHMARAEFPLEDVNGEGPFIYPAAYIGAFNSFTDGDISFEFTNETTADGPSYIVSYKASSGASSRRTSFDPKLMSTFDLDFEAAKDAVTFKAPILKEAISLAACFCAKSTEAHVEGRHKTIQVFDENYETDEIKDGKPTGKKLKPYVKGNGIMFAANGIQAFYFESDDFKDRSIELHSQDLPIIQGFLGNTDGNVTIKRGPNMTFASYGDDNSPDKHVIGWVHHAEKHARFSYYALAKDHVVLSVATGAVLNVLKYCRNEMAKGRDRLRVIFDATESALKFQVFEGAEVTSWPVPVKVIEGPEGTTELRSFQINVNVDNFKDIFDNVKGNTVQLRVSLVAKSGSSTSDSAAFRTIDRFLVDGNGKASLGDPDSEKRPEGTTLCKVTRFTTSMA